MTIPGRGPLNPSTEGLWLLYRSVLRLANSQIPVPSRSLTERTMIVCHVCFRGWGLGEQKAANKQAGGAWFAGPHIFNTFISHQRKPVSPTRQDPTLFTRPFPSLCGRLPAPGRVGTPLLGIENLTVLAGQKAALLAVSQNTILHSTCLYCIVQYNTVHGIEGATQGLLGKYYAAPQYNTRAY